MKTILAATCAMLGVFAAMPALAGAWDEKAIASHVDREAFTGMLDGARLDALLKAGETLFAAPFKPADGIGRPMATQAILPTKRKRPRETEFARGPGMEATSCAACHNLPKAGGAGDFVTNVFVSEGFESADFDSLDPQFSNERNTNHMFGAGLVELLAREMTAELQAVRDRALDEARRAANPVDAKLEAKGIYFGWITAAPDGSVDLTRIEGVDDDLIVKPFSQKGVFVSLRQFTDNAMNAHHGMEAAERYGKRWTGEDDFDGDSVPDELSDGDISALTAWQATLPPPTVAEPDDPAWRAAASAGSRLFDSFGCAECHTRALPLENTVFEDPGPYDAAGTLRKADVRETTRFDLAARPWASALKRDGKGRLLVPLFSDLKRHIIADTQVAAFGNELLAQRFVDRNVFATTDLWGIGSTAPYGHRGDMPTLDQAIRAHGGEGRKARDAYVHASDDDRSALVAFLKTLVIEP